MPHTLEALPFASNALEPVISARTIDLHYGKHHKGYVDKLNKLIAGTRYESMSLEDTVRRSSGVVFQNAAQAWNHSFYWKSLRPGGKAASGLVFDAVVRQFGNLDRFNAEFRKAAEGQFGSGWVWLVADSDGNVDIFTTSNADTPLRHGRNPLLTVDVWEHAYYLDYQNERGRYLDSISTLLDWEFAERGFKSTLLRTAG